MKVLCVGAGYVGLVSGACIAEIGHSVICVDHDRSKVAALNDGRVPIFEPGLPDLVAKNRTAGRLRFSAQLSDGLDDAPDIVIIAVGTPPRERDAAADLTWVFGAAKDIALGAKNPLMVVTKSTVPVGTGDTLQKLFRRMRPDLELVAASNPEFLREGSAIQDFMTPDRIVVGAESPAACDLLRQLYGPLIEAGAPFLATDLRTAELIKYASNAFLAVKISFINEMADLCERIGTNIDDVGLGMGLDKRIGSSFLKAGPGYGGSCFPKDTMALLRTAQDHATTLRLIEETVVINDSRKRRMSRKVIEALDGNVSGKVLAVLGLAFKGNTDDVRESPSLPIVEALQREGAIVRAYDPEAAANAAKELSDVEFCSSALECVTGADGVVICTEWDEFAHLDLKQVAGLMRSSVVVDLRGVINRCAAERAGLNCTTIGHATPPHAATQQVDFTRSADPSRLTGAMVHKNVWE